MAIVNYLDGTYRTFGELPTVGSRAPDVSLVNTELQDVTLGVNWYLFPNLRLMFNYVYGDPKSNPSRVGDGHIAQLRASFDF